MPWNPDLASRPYVKVESIADHVKENLIAGVEPHQKRVVIHLAERSRIFNTETGTYRTYDDFVEDWTYIGSKWVADETCTLCGKKHIRRACTIEDQGTGDRMVVGSECVHTHLTIVTDAGEHLTGDAKRDFLKVEMEKAKDRFFKVAWEDTWDMSRWPEIYRLYTEVIPKGRHNPERNIVRRIQRRLDSKGYISEGTSSYDWFVASHPLFEETLARYAEPIRIHDTSVAHAAKIAGGRATEATAFRNRYEWLVDVSSEPPVDARDVRRTEQAIRRYGAENLRWGNQTTYQIVMSHAPGKTYTNPFTRIINEGKANEWERGFLTSVGDRIASGSGLSSRQTEVLKKVLIRLGIEPEAFI